MSRIRRESNIRIFITRRKNQIQRDIHNSAQLSNFNQASRKSRFEPILVFEGKRKRKREKGVRSKGEGEEKERIHSTEETIAFIHSRTIHVRRREAENARAIAYDLSFCSSPSHPTESPLRRRPHDDDVVIASSRFSCGPQTHLYTGLIGFPLLFPRL